MNCFFSDEVANMLDFIKNKSLDSAEVITVGDCFGLEKYINEIESRRKKTASKTKVIVCALDFHKANAFDAKAFFESNKNYSQYIFVSTFGFEKAFPGSITAVSEREADALAEYDSSFSSLNSLVAFQNSLKPYADKLDIRVLRYTEIFGTEINCVGEVNSLISDFRSSNSISIAESDFSSYISVSYVSAVLHDIYSIISNGARGNIYNGSNMKLTVADIKNSIYKSFVSKNSELIFSSDEKSCRGYRALSCHKIRSISDDNTFSVDEALLKTILDSEEMYIENYVKSSYDGKVEIIRQKEKEILCEVDRICKKHSIDYYLVGGSLLGAVRNQGFIPWDDDVDICMLREDFEKFRSICPKELDDAYAYQSYSDEKSTHYIYDKIRLKGTYFSSEHSNKYDDMENGVFLDVFVFDKTANSKLLQKLHVYLIVMLRRLIHIRWTKEPVNGKFAAVSALILPLVCILPFGFYHGLFEKILRFFEKSKSSRFLLDGTGLYIKKGAFPAEWATGSKPVMFENTEFPGVNDAEGYLSRWYGEGYMTPPEISKRTSGHKISRLDLGKHIYDNHSESSISLSGELYD